MKPLKFSTHVLKALRAAHKVDNSTRSIAFKDQRLNRNKGLITMATKSKATNTAPKTTKATKQKTATAIAKALTKANKPQTIPTLPTLPAPVAVVSPDIAQHFGLDKLPATLIRIEEPKPEPLATVTGAYKIDISKGDNDSRVSREWYSRPEDQRFTSFKDLDAFLQARKASAREHLIDIHGIEVTGTEKAGLAFLLPHADGTTRPVYPTNFAAVQLAQTLKIPMDYLFRQSPEHAAACIRQGFKELPSGQVKALTYQRPDQDLASLAAITSPSYGRVFDADIIECVKWLFAIDDQWKIPGEMDWRNMTHNPYVDTTKDNTTLFASDRDVFMFFCKDHQPIEAGKTAKGETDVYFPGFYVWGTEVGEGTTGMKSMMLRGVCMNRNLWGCEEIGSFEIRHGKHVKARFETMSAVMIKSLHQAKMLPFVRLIEAAKAQVVAKTPDDALEFLRRLAFGKTASKAIIETSIREEEREPRTVFDFSQAMTAYARTIPFQDQRRQLELTANEVLNRAA